MPRVIVYNILYLLTFCRRICHTNLAESNGRSIMTQTRIVQSCDVAKKGGLLSVVLSFFDLKIFPKIELSTIYVTTFYEFGRHLFNKYI